MAFSYKRNLYVIFLIGIVTVLGFYSKVYPGPYSDWVNDSLSGVLYVLFWCLLFFLILPGARVILLPSLVFIITSALECLQLWHPPLLETVRQSFIGRTLLGTTFVWSDFFYYFIGCAIAYYSIVGLKRIN